MKVSRRKVLVSAAVMAGTLPVSARALGIAGGTVIVFDSRSKPSTAWAEARTGLSIDVAQTGHDLWRALRDIPAGSVVAGCTSWSDFLVVRGQMRASGLRVQHFTQHRGLVEWGLGK